jgi:hypothetical protein
MGLSNWLLAFSRWWYGTAVKLYPTQFRTEFEAEMVWLFGLLCRDAVAQAGYAALLKVWWRTASDLILSVGEQHWLVWRDKMSFEDDSKLLRLVAALCGLLAIVALGWGIYATAFHANGLAVRPSITINWQAPPDSEASEFVVYRAPVEQEEAVACMSVSPADYVPIPQNISRVGGIYQVLALSEENLIARKYQLEDDYQVKRGDLFCYKVERLLSTGSTETIARNYKFGVPGYHWGVIASGFTAVLLAWGLVLLMRRLWGLATRLGKPALVA